MTPRKETAELARRVEAILRIYMEIQEDLFRPSLRKMIPIPGIYKPADYGADAGLLEGILLDLSAVKGDIRRMDPIDGRAEGKFLGHLRGYVSLLGSAAEKLLSICRRLEARSSGGQYGREEYKRDIAELREIQRKHLEAGATLNELVKGLGESSGEEGAGPGR